MKEIKRTAPVIYIDKDCNPVLRVLKIATIEGEDYALDEKAEQAWHIEDVEMTFTKAIRLFHS